MWLQQPSQSNVVVSVAMGPRIAAVGLEPTTCPGGSSSFEDSPIVTQTALSIELRRPDEAGARCSGINGSPANGLFSTIDFNEAHRFVRWNSIAMI